MHTQLCTNLTMNSTLKIGKGKNNGAGRKITSQISLHKNWNFLLKISSVNVTISSGTCGFCHIY